MLSDNCLNEAKSLFYYIYTDGIIALQLGNRCIQYIFGESEKY